MSFPDQLAPTHHVTYMVEEAIQATVSHAHEATGNLAEGVSNVLGHQLNTINDQRRVLDETRDTHFADYRAAHTAIEAQRLELAAWQGKLDEKQKQMESLEEKAKKAADEKEAFEAEQAIIKAKLEKERKELTAAKKENEELLAECEAKQKEVEAQKRAATTKRIKALLNQPTVFPPARPPPPSVSRPFIHTKGFGQPHTKREVYFSPIPPSSPSESEEDISDEESHASFKAAFSFPSRDVMVESDRFAFDPSEWRNRLTASVIERVLMYLRLAANTTPSTLSDHIMDDYVIMLRGLMHTIMRAPLLLDDKHFITSIQTILKRILMFKASSAGHSAAYVKAFSEAVDCSESPQWVRAAHRSALKASAGAPTRTTSKKETKKYAKKDGKN